MSFRETTWNKANNVLQLSHLSLLRMLMFDGVKQVIDNIYALAF